MSAIHSHQPLWNHPTSFSNWHRVAVSTNSLSHDSPWRLRKRFLIKPLTLKRSNITRVHGSRMRLLGRATLSFYGMCTNWDWERWEVTSSPLCRRTFSCSYDSHWAGWLTLVARNPQFLPGIRMLCGHQCDSSPLFISWWEPLNWEHPSHYFQIWCRGSSTAWFL